MYYLSSLSCLISILTRFLLIPFQMSGDIRSSDSEDLTDSSENARLANGSARSKNKSNSGAPAAGGAGGATQRKSNNANNHTTEAAGGAATTAAQ